VRKESVERMERKEIRRQLGGLPKGAQEAGNYGYGHGGDGEGIGSHGVDTWTREQQGSDRGGDAGRDCEGGGGLG
jgi:hypothetical protein